MGVSNRKGRAGAHKRIPNIVLGSDAFINLSSSAKALIFDLLWQYSGFNNGGLTASYDLLKKRKWSKSTLGRAKNELIEVGFVIVTRQGTKVRGHFTALALTWVGINEPKKMKYDVDIKVSDIPLRLWGVITKK